MISKRASVKAIAYAEKKAGKTLAKNSNWESIFDILMEGYTYSVYSKHTGDTVVKLYEGDAKDALEVFTIPNSEVFFDNDWDWSYIFKTIIEWMMRKRKGAKKVKLSQKQIKDRITELRDIIKDAKGADKRKAIKEYNELSKHVIREEKPATTAPQQLSIRELRDIRNSLYPKISYAKKRGRDTSELENKLKEIQKQIKNYKK